MPNWDHEDLKSVGAKREDATPMSPERRGDWMQTYTGRAFWPLDPRAEEIHPVDIAHALSLQCRFAGHCRVFYSVAEHSVRVARLLRARALWRGQELAGLLHDAAEAYLVDLPRPIKRHSAIGRHYEAAERDLMGAIEARFGLAAGALESREITHADCTLLATEARDLMGHPPMPWTSMPLPLPERIEPWAPERAEAEWMAEFHTLFAE